MIWFLYTTILGLLLLFFGVMDGVKYHIVANKVRENKSAKSHSRQFTNYTLGKDIVVTLYLLTVKPDHYLLIMTLIGFVFALEYFWQIYIFYPYKGRGLHNFRRPNLWKYFVNSLQRNSKRKRL
jgi:formate-dependent nitrite reductase membrane component NrfD